MKASIKWVIIIITSLIFLYAFSASYNTQNVDHLDYVIALGIDSIPDNENLEISFEFANLNSFSDNSSSDNNEPIIDTVEAPSLSTGINIINSYIGKQLNLSHCKVIVFSKDFAKKGLIEELGVIVHNTQIRPTTNIIIAEDTSYEYLKNSVSSLEQVLTKYYNIFPYSSEYTGYTSNISLGQFHESLKNKDAGTVTILGKKSKVSSPNSSSKSSTDSSSSSKNSDNSESEVSDNPVNNANSEDYKDIIQENESILKGDRGTQNIGLGVFSGDMYIGDLSVNETLCYSLIKDEVDTFLVHIDSPFEENSKIDISVGSLSNFKYNVDTSNENPNINIRFNLTAKVLTPLDDIYLPYDEKIEKLNSSLKDYLSKLLYSYLYKTSREYKSDINGFYRYAKHEFTTISDYNNYDWKSKYENAEFKIDFNEKIISSLIIQNN